MLVTDAQIHIWDIETPVLELPDEAASRNPLRRSSPIPVDELLATMDEAGVRRAILIPPTREGSRNGVALAAAHLFPERFGVMGLVDLATQSTKELEVLRSQPGMLGARLTFFLPERKTWILDGTLDWFWHAAEEFSMPLMIFAPGLTPQIGELARRFPGLPIILDHLNIGKETLKDGLEAAFETVYAIASESNVAVKVSALPCYVSDNYPFSTLRKHIVRIIHTFGVNRCMWGSDLTRLPCPYSEWTQATFNLIDFLNTSDQESFMNGTISSWLNWPPNVTD